MNRRGFLARLVAGAVAVVGIGAVEAQKAAASEAVPLPPSVRDIIMAEMRVKGGGVDRQGVEIVNQPLAFEQMQADCKARGCLLDSQYSVYHLAMGFVHQRRDTIGIRTPDILLVEKIDQIRDRGMPRVDRWRRGLHA